METANLFVHGTQMSGKHIHDLGCALRISFGVTVSSNFVEDLLVNHAGFAADMTQQAKDRKGRVIGMEVHWVKYTATWIAQQTYTGLEAATKTLKG